MPSKKTLLILLAFGGILLIRQLLGPEFRDWVAENSVWFFIAIIFIAHMVMEDNMNSAFHKHETEVDDLRNEIRSLEQQVTDLSNDVFELERFTGRKPSALP